MTTIPTELHPGADPALDRAPVEPDLDVEIDLRDGREPSATVPPSPPASPDPGTPVRAGRRRSPRLLAAVRRSLHIGAWVAVVAGVALLVLPTVLGFDRYAIMGGSMSPTFEVGSAVFSQDVPVDTLRVGDVITYVPPASTGIDTLVTHRITDIAEAEDGRPLLTTKGDANDAADPWTFSLDEDRQNVVAFSVPHLGTLLTWLSDPGTRQLVIGIPAAMIAFGAVLELLGFASLGEAVGRLRRRQVPVQLVEEGLGGPV
jgi:signal peptidase I